MYIYRESALVLVSLDRTVRLKGPVRIVGLVRRHCDDVCEFPGLPCDYWKRARGTTDRARTSGGNKDKDNDGDQGGDIPAWMSNVEDEKEGSEEERL